MRETAIADAHYVFTKPSFDKLETRLLKGSSEIEASIEKRLWQANASSSKPRLRGFTTRFLSIRIMLCQTINLGPLFGDYQQKCSRVDS
ncbi:hypothetical protein J3F83DRAFT_728592 [Trichoderma novae-zelandiae]